MISAVISDIYPYIGWTVLECPLCDEAVYAQLDSYFCKICKQTVVPLVK